MTRKATMTQLLSSQAIRPWSDACVFVRPTSQKPEGTAYANTLGHERPPGG